MTGLLVSAGAAVNGGAGPDERTALMLAAASGHAGVVGILLERGARINDPSREGWTALLLAARGEHPSVVEHLLAAGADVNARLCDVYRARTALAIARAALSASREAARWLEGEQSKKATAARRREKECLTVVRLLEQAGATE